MIRCCDDTERVTERLLFATPLALSSNWHITITPYHLSSCVCECWGQRGVVKRLGVSDDEMTTGKSRTGEKTYTLECRGNAKVGSPRTMVENFIQRTDHWEYRYVSESWCGAGVTERSYRVPISQHFCNKNLYLKSVKARLRIPLYALKVYYSRLHKSRMTGVSKQYQQHPAFNLHIQISLKNERSWVTLACNRSSVDHPRQIDNCQCLWYRGT